MKKNKRTIILSLGIILTLILTISISYAFFYYVEEGDEITLTSGSISIDFAEGTNYISLANSYPKSDMMGKIDPNYYDFTVTGSRGEKDDIYYEIQIVEEEGNTLDDKYVKVYLTDQKNNSSLNKEIMKPILLSECLSSDYNGKSVIYSSYIYDANKTQDFRLRVWIDESYSENVTSIYNFKINLYAINNDFVSLYDTVEQTLSPFLLDDDGDARIVSGSQDEVNNNYVWYSGKLWRIVALNNNGTIKLVTDENITTISYGESYVYENSWIYQWLNEDFLDTLYNYENLLLTDYLWNATQTKTSDKPIETTMVSGIVGLLNYYEYSSSYYNSSYNLGYLNNGFRWWLINSFNDSTGYWVRHDGYPVHLFYDSDGSNCAVRPSIVLNKDIEFISGDGSKVYPYKIRGDIDDSKINDLLNSRISGEYLYFDKELYRIIGIEDNKTKIIKYDYIRDETNEVVIKYRSVKREYGSMITNEEYWDFYLNYIWHKNIDSEYKKMILYDTWYLGRLGWSRRYSYKNAICATDNTIETTKECERYSSIYNGYIGLGRIGEMFVSQSVEGYDDATILWTITSATTDPEKVWAISDFRFDVYDNGAEEIIPYNNRFAVRPSMFLSPRVYITSGSGTLQDPFEISMD